MKLGLQVNGTFKQKLQNLTDEIEEELREDITTRINAAVRWSPVDTGAFAESWSLKNNYSSGRGVSSRGKPRNQPAKFHREVGRANMLNDLAAIDLKNSTAIVISNGAPHAPYVENKHKIFASLRALGRI